MQAPGVRSEREKLTDGRKDELRGVQSHSGAAERWGSDENFHSQKPRQLVPRSYRLCILSANRGRFAFSRVHGSRCRFSTHALPLPVQKQHVAPAWVPKFESRHGARACAPRVTRSPTQNIRPPPPLHTLRGSEETRLRTAHQ